MSHPATLRLRRHGDPVILEDAGLEVADALGLATPPRVGLTHAGELGEGVVEAWPVARVVVKVVSPRVVHRSREGALETVAARGPAVRDAVARLARRFGAPDVTYLVEGWVEAGPGDGGGELLLGLRTTAAWGPVVVVAPGGVGAEARTDALREGAGPWMTRGGGALPRRGFVEAALTGAADASAALEALASAVDALAAWGPEAAEAGLVDLEFNPVRWVGGRWVALDALGHRAMPAAGVRAPAGAAVDPARVLEMLHPRSVAVVGASARGRNPGRIILRNVLEAGFDPEAVQVVKPGRAELDGCRCVDAVEALEPVDLLAVAVAARPAAEVLRIAAETAVARAVVLVSGGMEADEVQEALEPGRARGEAPVVVGPNCLGVRSVPGRIDTLFLPRDRVRFPEGEPAPLALVSQSGAFALTRLAALDELNPRYVITLGNQADVTLGRVAQALARDDEVRASAWYVEGFARGDGARWIDALAASVERGRPALVYPAGRTSAGREAAASHTASVAGDARVLREVCRGAGVAVVETLTAFEDAVALLAAWAHRDAPGPRLGVVSNAGFETVAAADGLGGLEAPALAAATSRRLEAVLEGAGVADYVPVVHPLDVTPMLGDEAFVAAAAAILDDPEVDVGVVGCVPLTPALDTPLEGTAPLPEPGGGDVTSRLVELWRSTTKPWLAVVDAGPGHDWMRRRLRAAGVPVVRSMDRVGPAVRGVLGPER